jgi:hypothetical protein
MFENELLLIKFNLGAGRQTMLISDTTYAITIIQYMVSAKSVGASGLYQYSIGIGVIALCL